MNKVRKTTAFVVERSDHVFIDKSAAEEVARQIQPEMNTDHWINDGPFDFSQFKTEDMLHLIVFFDVLSFSYWGDPKWSVKYKSREHDGSWALLACILRACEAGIDILNPHVWQKMTPEKLNQVLRGNTRIPLLKKRCEIINQIGSVLVSEYDGRFIHFLDSQDVSEASKIADSIVRAFPLLEDKAVYKEKTIWFNKKPQLLTSNIYNLFTEEPWAQFTNLGSLTACADYKLPQILRQLGILKYSDKLSEIITNKSEIPSGDPVETEIRACTIQAVDMITKKVNKEKGEYTTMEVNDYLWLLSQTVDREQNPYHRTRTTAY